MLASHPTCALLLATPGQPEFLLTPLNGLVACLGLLVSLVGVALLVWWAYVSIVRLIATETASARGHASRAEASSGRLLTSYLLPGLDFILAGLIIKMSVVPDWQQALVLTGVLVVRTVLGLSMKWDLIPEAGPRAVAPTTERLALPPTPAPGSNGTTADPARVGVQVGSVDALPADSQRAVV